MQKIPVSELGNMMKDEKYCEFYATTIVLQRIKPWPNKQFCEQCSTFMFCKCSSRLANIFDDKFHVGQSSALFENCLMKIKTFLELFHVLQMFVAFGHSDDTFQRTNEIFQCMQAYIRNFPTKICIVLRRFLNLNKCDTD